MRRLAPVLGLLSLLFAATASSDEGGTHTAIEVKPPSAGKLQYTTYFYTAGEAVVHGYEDDTTVRIVSMATGALVHKSTVGAGQTVLVPTGAGTFSFLSDKKASILVGTPSSCTVVGYWLRDETGANRSDHFFTQLPSSSGSPSNKLIVWGVGEKTQYRVVDRTAGAGTTLLSGSLAAGQRAVLDQSTLQSLASHTLEISADAESIMVQVYQDEGYTVPATSGSGMGREFYTFVGDVTEGVNDLNLVSYYGDATVTVQDMVSEDVIWTGKVAAGSVHTLTLTNRYVRVTSTDDLSVIVAPYAHYKQLYAEHHFGMGIEGGAIDTDFMLPTTTELWVFSYYADNHVTVTDIAKGTTVWEGDMAAGNVRGLVPGHGFYRVRSRHGISVMGGAGACGAEYSPAGGLFQVDEALLAAVVDIKRARVEEAAGRGVTLTQDEIDAPLTAAELGVATDAVRKSTGNAAYSPAEAAQRIDAMVVE